MPRIVERLRSSASTSTTPTSSGESASAAAVGRPHIADALVRRGVVRDRDEAFDRYLSPGRPALRQAVRRAARGRCSPPSRDAGGVLGHRAPVGPLRQHARSTRTAWRTCRRHGLAGIEVDHQDHGPAAARGAARDRPRPRPGRHRARATTTAPARSSTTWAATPPPPTSSTGSSRSPSESAPAGGPAVRPRGCARGPDVATSVVAAARRRRRSRLHRRRGLSGYLRPSDWKRAWSAGRGVLRHGRDHLVAHVRHRDGLALVEVVQGVADERRRRRATSSDGRGALLTSMRSWNSVRMKPGHSAMMRTPWPRYVASAHWRQPASRRPWRRRTSREGGSRRRSRR